MIVKNEFFDSIITLKDSGIKNDAVSIFYRLILYYDNNIINNI